jgi:hypothetical protein
VTTGVLRVAESERNYVVQFRKSENFFQVETPAWTREIAAEVAEGAHVRLGELGTSSVVESVLVPCDQAIDEDEAASIASRIAERVEP